MKNLIVSKEEWLVARKALPAEEKTFKRQRDELAEKRRAMPVIRVEKHCEFRTEDGPASLVGRSLGLHRMAPSLARISASSFTRMAVVPMATIIPDGPRKGSYQV